MSQSEHRLGRRGTSASNGTPGGLPCRPPAAFGLPLALPAPPRRSLPPAAVQAAVFARLGRAVVARVSVVVGTIAAHGAVPVAAQQVEQRTGEDGQPDEAGAQLASCAEDRDGHERHACRKGPAKGEPQSSPLFHGLPPSMGCLPGSRVVELPENSLRGRPERTEVAVVGRPGRLQALLRPPSGVSQEQAVS